MVVRRTDMPGNDHGQVVYVLRCNDCGQEYGANGSDIFFRRCPAHDNGGPGLPYEPGAGRTAEPPSIDVQHARSRMTVGLNQTLSGTQRLSLDEQLLGVLSPDRFSFGRDELHFLEARDLALVLPVVRDLVDEVWNAEGKNVTDRFLSVAGTYGMRCPDCRDDTALDVVAQVSVRLQRGGPSLEDSRDQKIRWDGSSACSCVCGWTGAVEDTQ